MFMSLIFLVLLLFVVVFCFSYSFILLISLLFSLLSYKFTVYLQYSTIASSKAFEKSSPEEIKMLDPMLC